MHAELRYILQIGGMDEEWQLKYSSFYNFSPSQKKKKKKKNNNRNQNKNNQKINEKAEG